MNFKIIFFFVVLFCFRISAHEGGKFHNNLREWQVDGKKISASFLLYNNKLVYLEQKGLATLKVPLSAFSKNDQSYIKRRIADIALINKAIDVKTTQKSGSKPNFVFWTLFLVFGLTLPILFISNRVKSKWLFCFVIFGVLCVCYSFGVKSLKLLHPASNPSTIDAAFMPFKPNVSTFWDANYFYVESKGIPSTHTMMVGISNHGWQQQVPIPQCYRGNNAWPIPLNPVVSNSPAAVNPSHFTRGAIAIAANGVPIFNVYTNTGVDSYIDGQLDNYGGHCGRADDYHYHTAPLHLYSTTASTLPIAYALDGFAVYGSLEPDGAAMQALDANHGHFGSNGVYHYHGTTTAPYMIKNFAGQVTEDNTLQLIPQAAASPVRTENWTPLAGALITACAPNGNGNGYNLTYSLNNNSGYATNYSWNNSGVYTFTYVAPGTSSTSVYNGFSQCQSFTAIKNNQDEALQIEIFPNPTSAFVYLKFSRTQQMLDVKDISVYDVAGKLVLHFSTFQERINTGELNKGVYFVQVKSGKQTYTKKLVIQ